MFSLVAQGVRYLKKREDLILRITEDPNELKKSFNIAGRDASWRDRIKKLCKAKGWNIETFVKAVHRFFHGDTRRGANNAWKAFENRKNPSVPEWLRRLACHLEALVRAKKPLPVAAA